MGADNEYNATGEPTNEDWVKATTCRTPEQRMKDTTGFLLDMARPAFPSGISTSNIGALLKRCSICLNTENFVYFRPAGKNCEVVRYSLVKSYITDEAGTILYNFLEHGIKRDEEEYNRLLTFEKRIMNELLGS